jgi:hypothetical protein
MLEMAISLILLVAAAVLLHLLVTWFRRQQQDDRGPRVDIRRVPRHVQTRRQYDGFESVEETDEQKPNEPESETAEQG